MEIHCASWGASSCSFLVFRDWGWQYPSSNHIISSVGNQPARKAFQEPPATIHLISIQKVFAGFGEDGLGAVCQEPTMDMKYIFLIINNFLVGYDGDRE